ncbi:N,N-dimethylformamidase beta subunit family domain-containing protein [Microbispora sp. H10670]|uniref:N,N-dimethylformamidase beta subunit family domain-containing protein n=1 Tax=Microbispora sp. H10670 TaxID=2729108 RepID=UPI0015FEE89E|nr:N,N-dimethylformamidase beta subunit family domain-containing protein [Microbispora sp. H10670]
MTEEPEPHLMAYADVWSAVPGQTVSVYGSGPRGTVDVDLVDLVTDAVLTPASPVSVEPRPLEIGSHLEIPSVPAPARGSLALWIRPHRLGTRQVLADLTAGEWRLLLALDEEGRAEVRVGTPSGRLHGRAPSGVREGSWFLVAAAWEATPATTTVHLTVGGGGESVRATGHAPPPPAGTGALRLGAGPGRDSPYIGRIALPLLTRSLLTGEACAPLLGLTTGAGLLGHAGDDVVALWDPSADPGAPLVPDVSGNGHHARAVNRPLAGLAGPEGDAGKPAHTAVQLSPEDLDDARWPETCALTVPGDTTSTVLGIRLRGGSRSFVAPLIVRPPGPPHEPASRPLAVVLPTFTYTAYANHRQSSEAEYFGDYSRVTTRRITLSPVDAYLNRHRELGLSLYDSRLEGGAVYYSSRRRPVLNYTADYVWWMTGAPRHFSADILLLRWLRSEGFAFDVLADEDVHAGGADLLAGYRVVMTGSHPEYISAPERAAVGAYVSGGGRLMYLGGNGFYWVTGVDPRYPYAIEVRRRGTGDWWDNEPGEDVLTSNGEPGGLWRRQGLPPQELLGVGFAAQGWGPAPGYTRLPDSYRDEAAWIFDGVETEVVGAYGLALGGAAGDEIDRAAPELGTPPGTLVLATSAGGHGHYYQPAAEDASPDGDTVRADMTLRRLGGGGAVFSVGSVNWVASLAAREGDISRITRNVLSRFLLSDVL